MKKLLILLIISLSAFLTAAAQKVDSVKIEQTGDFVKIRYKITGSKPGQVYRVRVLCSINGGLNTELRSVSGDTGDHVAGGLKEYWVVWDVLKDVDELKSAEFIVRAELLQEINKNNESGPSGKINTTGWDNKGNNVFLAAMAPGPKFGLRFGYMRSFGFLIQFVKGKTVLKAPPEASSSSYVPLPKPALGLDISKRIVNIESFQMHLLAGFEFSNIAFYKSSAVTVSATSSYSMQPVEGGEIGFVMSYKAFSSALAVTNYDHGHYSRNSDGPTPASPRFNVSVALGVRF